MPTRRTSVVDALDKARRSLAQRGRAKLADGGEPTAREAAAMSAMDDAEASDLRWSILSKIPKSVYLDMADRDGSQLNRQGDRYGLPLRGKTVNMIALVKAFHDLIADRDAGRSGEPSPQDELARIKAEHARMDLEERRGNLLNREAIAEVLGQWASRLRRAGDLMQRKFERAAFEVLDDALKDCEGMLGGLMGDVKKRKTVKKRKATKRKGNK